MANIGGIITAPAPIGQDGIIYVRWYNFNDVGTDGAIAIDNVCLTVTSSEEAVLFVAVPSPTNGQAIDR